MGAPYETAQTQCLVAEAALRLDDRHVAIVEVDAAIAAFENLGAGRDLDEAQRLRHRLGATTIGRPVRRTFMFTDIVDSTRLVAERGDEAWSRIMHGHDLTIRELLAKHQGIEVRQRGGGDGFFAVFTNPADAVDCAIAIQQRLAEQRDIVDFVPQVRIGVHEADALMSGNDFAGLGVHEAARIGAYADAGSSSRAHPPPPRLAHPPPRPHARSRSKASAIGSPSKRSNGAPHPSRRPLPTTARRPDVS